MTCLDPDTANKADIEVKKRSLGTIKGTVVEIQDQQGPTYIAEGIETALSLKEARIKGRILVSLGLSNMANIGAHLRNKDEQLILCADADGPQSAAWKTSQKALERLTQEGFKVSLIRPQGENGRDFNDVLQEEGIQAVRSALKDQALFEEILNAEETQLSQHASYGSVEKETISSELGRPTKTKEEKDLLFEIKTAPSYKSDSLILQENNSFKDKSQNEAEKYSLNALELYLACQDTLKLLPTFTEAEGKQKELVTSLSKDARKYAHQIWNDASLKTKAQELGIEEEIKIKASLHKYDINLGVNRKTGHKFSI